MEPTIEILIGAPVLLPSEAMALKGLVSSLRPPALILANFEVQNRSTSRQIDFVAVTLQRAELIELKELTRPVKGGQNGSWLIEDMPGLFVPYTGLNPYVQCRDAKYALSDLMHAFVRRGSAPKPRNGAFYKQFDASVAVYPKIQPGSQLAPGDHKVRIKSFPDLISDLNSNRLPEAPSWGLPEWREFATKHLNLKSVPLAAAIEPSVFSAHLQLEEFGIRIKEQPIAPLIIAALGEMTGENLIAELFSAGDALLLGRSGLGKSFHLEHFRRRCVELGEIPILLHAGHYRGDLNRAIHKTIGPYTSLTPAELIEAARRAGRSLVLIADDWSKCSAGLQADLSNDLASFKVRYGARVVVASQERPVQPFFTKAKQVELASLRPEQKRQIFVFHAAGRETTSGFDACETFSTAFDVSIAARSWRSGNAPVSRWELYDRYTRSKLPNVAARSILRRLAWFMGENFRALLSTAEYEQTSEQLASEVGAPVTVLEEVSKSGLLIVGADTVSFEHDLLKDFFRAESLRRVDSGTLIQRLTEPKYADLAEFVIPNVSDETTLRQLLARADSRLLSLGFRRGLGRQTQKLIRRQCQDLLARTRDSLPEVSVEPIVSELENGRRFVFGAYTDDGSSVSSYEARLCGVIAANLDDCAFREAFLELLEVGEWALKAAADRAAIVQRLKPLPVWGELIRINVICGHSRPIHPLLLTCAYFCENGRFGKSSSSSQLLDALLEKIRAKTGGSLSQLLLMAALRHSDSISVEDAIALFSQAWDGGVHIIRVEALEFLQYCSRSIHSAGPQAEARIVELLEGLDVSKDPILSTEWLETRVLFSGFECGISVDDALAEYRRILAIAENGDHPLRDLKREQEPVSTFEQFIGRYASSALGKIFENVFQGVYHEAYESLTAQERQELLTLALQEKGTHFFQAWYLRELRKLGCATARVKDILLRFGSVIDEEACCPQENVETFVVANEWWATVGEEPIAFAEGSSPDHRAWAIFGELIFWLNRSSPEDSDARVAVLLRDLRAIPQAVPDVLQHVGTAFPGPRSESPFSDLVAKHPEGVRAALNRCLDYEGRLTSTFRGAEHRQRELFSWVIETLAKIGDDESLAKLRDWTNHATYGKLAIRAIETIERQASLRKDTQPAGLACELP